MRSKVFQYILLSATLHVLVVGTIHTLYKDSKAQMALKGDMALLDINEKSYSKTTTQQKKSQLNKITAETPNKVATNNPVAVSDIAVSPNSTESNTQPTVIDLGNANHTSNPELASWLKEVLQKVRDNTIYPRLAQKNNITGKATVILNMDKTGSILDSKIKSSSGSAILDEAALQIFAKIKKLPESPFLTENSSLVVPIEYILK